MGFRTGKKKARLGAALKNSTKGGWRSVVLIRLANQHINSF